MCSTWKASESDVRGGLLPSVNVLVNSKGTWLSEQSPGVNLLLILRVVGWGKRGQTRRFHAGAPGWYLQAVFRELRVGSASSIESAQKLLQPNGGNPLWKPNPHRFPARSL